MVAPFEEDPAGEGRFKVFVPAIDATEEAVWARLATLDAGPERGVLFRPEPGDEVIVGFVNQDPRHPVILGSLFGSMNATPPALQAPSEDNFHKGIVTRSGLVLGFDDDKSVVYVETPGGNKVRVDDDEQKIELEDQHGNMITMSSDGIAIKSAGDFKIEASGSVEIEGSSIDLK
jgi:uncharacterized protein involved in type VI secretion and phage assembly